MRFVSLLTCAALATTAAAAPVAFDNSGGQFVQWYSDAEGPNSVQGACFNPTRSPTSQPSPNAGNCSPADSRSISYRPPHANSTPGSITLQMSVTTTAGSHPFLTLIPAPALLGDPIGPATNFGTPRLAHLQDPAASTPPTQFTFTSGGYLGLRWIENGVTRYGWVRYAYAAAPPMRSRWQPVEWGYETMPGVPVTVNTAACVDAGDYNADGATTFGDLNDVLSGFGNVYSFAHLNTVLSNFGQTCR